MTVLELEAVAYLHGSNITKWPKCFKRMICSWLGSYIEYAEHAARQEQKALEANRALARIQVELNT
jgi:TorA maturation chaperone TorD